MGDSLYLSLWFPRFDQSDILPQTVSVLRQLPFSGARDGVTYAAIQPVSWSEPTILERRFRPGVAPEEAAEVVAELLHDDYAYVFDAYWDLWTPSEGAEQWGLVASPVKFILQGEEFGDGAFEQTGHIEVDLGLDSPFLQETVAMTEETQAKIRDNVAKLVEFTLKVEKNTRASARTLWSESEENLAQKLITRLQKVQ